MISIHKITRAVEWWEYKLPPMLGIGYATALSYGKDLYKLAPVFCILLWGIIIGAAYVSIVNDFTDLKDDNASGKYNRLSHLPPLFGIMLVLTCLFAGALFVYFFLHDILSIVLYSSSWIAFSLYSIPPFRLKKRGAWGVLADACGAHLFPTLFFLSGTANYMHAGINWFWFSAVGIWSLMYGLRGILWHQFFDRDNDLKIGLATYASGKDPRLFNKQSFFIISIEFAALAFMLVFIAEPLPLITLLFYLLMLVGYGKILKHTLIAIVPPTDHSWHFIMNNYYQFFFPLSLLLSAAFIHPAVWILFIFHFILFPIIARNTIFDLLGFIKVMMKKLIF